MGWKKVRKEIFRAIDEHLNEGCGDQDCDPGRPVPGYFSAPFVDHLTDVIMEALKKQ